MSRDTWKRDAALVAVAQCLVDHKLIPDSDMGGKSWLKGGTVVPSAELASWANEHSDTVYGGKKLYEWEDEATAAWPDWRCPCPAASAS